MSKEELQDENKQLREALQHWLDWYKDSDAVGGPRRLTQELLDKNQIMKAHDQQPIS